jgi:2-polyprenyl-6-methoxyphenol hydroxylase-like FAD-dependent oxidoreductase
MNSSSNKTTINTKSACRDALVIGGSLAGLFAARVLADFFNTVTILDRDIFPLTPDHRKGVPQSYHAHGLLLLPSLSLSSSFLVSSTTCVQTVLTSPLT